MTERRIDRRTLLRAGAGLGLAMATGPLDVLGLFGRSTAFAAGGPEARRAPGNGGYGPLKPAGPILDLPEGFRYIRFGDEGSPMADGSPTPGNHDGMGAFPGGRGIIRLVRNHEIEKRKAFARRAYDPVAGGGTTTMVFDAKAGKVLRTFPSLAGTFRNCAGGKTPWGSWLTCEEGTSGPKAGLDRLHGYVFEVPSMSDGPADPHPLRAMGRFVHEAVAVDPTTGTVYLTEDRTTAGFYRFLPIKPGALQLGGRLQMLAVDGRPHYDTRAKQPGDVKLPVTWVDIDDPDPPDAGWNPLSVFHQGLKAGGAIFARLEGCTFDQGRVLLTATSGGDAGCGQIWEYRDQPDGRGVLRLVFESPSASFLRSPDNVVVSPRGGVLVCEDHDGNDRLVGIDPEGRVFEFARNRLNHAEFAGLTYGPAIGYWLFVNVQKPGMTLAITGPWERGCL